MEFKMNSRILFSSSRCRFSKMLFILYYGAEKKNTYTTYDKTHLTKTLPRTDFPLFCCRIFFYYFQKQNYSLCVIFRFNPPVSNGKQVELLHSQTAQTDLMVEKIYNQKLGKVVCVWDITLPAVQKNVLQQQFSLNISVFEHYDLSMWQ